MNFQAARGGPPLMLFRIGIYCRFAVNSDSAFAEFHSYAISLLLLRHPDDCLGIQRSSRGVKNRYALLSQRHKLIPTWPNSTSNFLTNKTTLKIRKFYNFLYN